MAVTAVTITSGPTVVGRSVTISGTLNRDGGGTYNTLNFYAFNRAYTVGQGLINLVTGNQFLNVSGSAGTNIPWSYTGTVPEGDYREVTIDNPEFPYQPQPYYTRSATEIGLVQLRKPLPGIWTPNRDSRGLFVPKTPTYPSFAGNLRNYDKAKSFFYPIPNGIYCSNTDYIERLGEYGGIAKGVATQYGLGIDTPRNWEKKGPWGSSTSLGTTVLVSVFSLYNASKYLSPADFQPWPAVLGESRAKGIGYEFVSVAAWYKNESGEQALRINPTSYGDGLNNFYINGIGNGLHCLVLCYTRDGGASGVRAFLNGQLVATGPSTYDGFWGHRPYYYWGSLSQSDLNMGNVHFNGHITNLNLTDAQAAQLSTDPYRQFFIDAPKTSAKRRLFGGVLSLPDPPTKFSTLKTNPYPWRQQPTYRAQLNTANPLTQGIIHAGTPHHDVSDAVGSLSWKDSPRPPIGTGRSGLFWASGPYSTYSLTIPGVYENTDQTSLWIVSYEYDSYTGTFPDIKGPSGGDNSGSGIGVRADGNIVYFGGYQSTLIDTGVKIPLRATSVIVLTSNASGTSIYLNGNKIAFTATRYAFSDGYYNTLNRLGYVGAYGNYITVQERAAYPVYTYGVAQWITALSDAQAKQLSENPWQIFKSNPGRTYFLPAADTSFKGGKFLPQRWKTQPRGALTIDRGHSLSSGLCAAWHPAAQQYIGPGIAPSPTGTYAYQADASGAIGVRFNGAVTPSRIVLPEGSAGFGTGYSGTRLVLFRGFGNQWGLVNGITLATGSGNDTLGMRLNGGAGQIFLVRASIEVVATATIPTSSNPTVALCTANDITQETRLHVNGQFLGSNTRAYASSNGGIWVGAITNHNSDSNFFLALSWDRALSIPEATAIQENPWQIFKPKIARTFFLPANRSKFFFLLN